MKLKSLSLAVAVAAGFAASNASALTLFTLTQFQDDNQEYIIDANKNGVLDVGDRLRSVVEWDYVANLSGSGSYEPADSNLELKGISEIELLSTAGGLYVFGPSASFQADYGPGAMAAVFLDTIPGGNFSLVGNGDCISILDCETKATSGSLYMTLGFGSDPDNYWIATLTPEGALTGGSIAGIVGASASTPLATASYALTVLFNGTGYSITSTQNATLSCVLNPGTCDDKLADVIGNGIVFGGAGLTNGMQARSDFDYQFSAYRVPEPSTVALIGLGLLGLGLGARRRKAS